MSEVQQKSSISNLAGIAVLLIILSLSVLVIFQRYQLTESVYTLAYVSAKCSK